LEPALGLLDRVERPYIRLLGVLGDQRFYLISGYMKPLYLPPECLRGLSRRERRKLRQEARRYARQLLLCLEQVSPTGGSGGCSPFDPHSGDPGFSASGERDSASPRHPWTLGALIPDGVARVVARYHGGPTFGLPVLRNFVAFQITHSTKRHVYDPHRRKPVVINDPFPYSTTWLGADGRVIRRFRSPLSAR
jgi:hypothetical protein